MGASELEKEMKPMQKKMSKKICGLLLALCMSAQAQGVQIKAIRKDGNEKGEDGSPKLIIAWGSAVFVGKHRILTCAHVIENGESIFVKAGGEWVECFKKKTDKENDLALLETVASGEVTDLADIPPLRISGSPQKFPPELMSIRETSAVLNGAYIRCAIDIGDSGGPVTADGKLIGIVSDKALLDDVPYAKIVGADKIADFLK